MVPVLQQLGPLTFHPFQIVHTEIKIIENTFEQPGAKILISMNGNNSSAQSVSTLNKYMAAFPPKSDIAIFEQ